MKSAKKRKRYGGVILKVLFAIFGALVATLIIMLVASCVRHKKLLKEEEQYMTPPGTMVEIDGHKIHVVHEGDFESDTTLVFIHSNKTADDSIALEPLFDNLSKYELVYIDRSGVGFSEDYDASKDIDSMLEETRAALKAVSDNDKYTLVATKSGGLLAFDWAFKYPEEVESIIGLEMYFPEQYKDIDDDKYCSFGNRILVGLVKAGAHRFAKNIFPTDESSVYTTEQMHRRNALVAKNLYTKAMYNEDKEVVKNAKKLIDYGWPEDVKMYLIYANPFMDPYLHENESFLDIYNQVAEQGEEYDCEASYNSYYRDYMKDHANVTVEEVSSTERLIVYNPQKISELIENYIN